MARKRYLIVLAVVGAALCLSHVLRRESARTGLHLTATSLERVAAPAPLAAPLTPPQAPAPGDPERLVLSALPPPPIASTGHQSPALASPKAAPDVSLVPAVQRFISSAPGFQIPQQAVKRPGASFDSEGADAGSNEGGSIRTELGVPVEIAEIRVAERTEPAALVKITARLDNGVEATLWRGYERLDLPPAEHVFPVAPGNVAADFEFHLDDQTGSGKLGTSIEAEDVEVVGSDGGRQRPVHTGPAALKVSGGIQLPKLPRDLTLGGALVP